MSSLRPENMGSSLVRRGEVDIIPRE
jgi:hypothetical protein